ncbi:hypothetical protein [Burkholderia orbicola]|uniref:hypothetical protein n=1 Tax=Burkholderia orbicola TaxID=2978683 RepID=UPI002FE0F86D
MFDLYSMGGVPQFDNPGALMGTDLSGLLQNGGLLVSAKSQDPNVHGVLWDSGNTGYPLVVNNSTGKIISASTASGGVRLTSSGENESLVAVCRVGEVDSEKGARQIVTESFGMWSEQGDFPAQLPLASYVMNKAEAAALLAMGGVNLHSIHEMTVIGSLATCSQSGTLMRSDPIGLIHMNKNGTATYGRLSLNGTIPTPGSTASGTGKKEATPTLIAAGYAPKLVEGGVAVGKISGDAEAINSVIAIPMAEVIDALGRGPGSAVAFEPELLSAIGVNPEGGKAQAFLTGATIGKTGVILLHVEGITGEKGNPNPELGSKSPYSYTFPLLLGAAPILDADGTIAPIVTELPHGPAPLSY